MFLPIDHIVTKTEKRVYIEMRHVVQKNRKKDPFNRKNGIFKKIQKSSISYGTRFS